MRRILFTILVISILLVSCQNNLRSFASDSSQPIVLTTSCPENVTIYFFDVGQGDSILIKTSDKNVLVDGGPKESVSALFTYLSNYHVTKIDLLFATHPHEDHIGGLVSLMQSAIPVQDVVYNGYNYTTQVFNNFRTLALTHNLTIAHRNQVYALSPTINFTVLSPVQPLEFSDINANSIVLKFQAGNTSVLLTGDATTDTEQRMLTSGLNLYSLVLKVGHHGSSSSTSQPFLNAVLPSYAIISAGVNNVYGHPSQQTLDRLTSNNIVTYGTYNYGTIFFSLNSGNPTPTSSSLPSSSPTPNASTNPSQTPKIPEFPSLLFVMGFVGLVSLSVLTIRRKNSGID